MLGKQVLEEDDGGDVVIVMKMVMAVLVEKEVPIAYRFSLPGLDWQFEWRSRRVPRKCDLGLVLSLRRRRKALGSCSYSLSIITSA